MKVYKAGVQSAADPWEFVMSTAAVDRVGDVVEQDWNLEDFKSNPIALWAHDSNFPIGTWESVAVKGKQLMGRLKLAAQGTSVLIDTLRSLVEQRVLKAVSVGFVPGRAVPLDQKNIGGGYRLSQNTLLECSLVAVPANPQALSIAKGLPTFQRDLIFTPENDPSLKRAAVQLGVIDPASLGSSLSAASGDVESGALLRAVEAAEATLARSERYLRSRRNEP